MYRIVHSRDHACVSHARLLNCISVKKIIAAIRTYCAQGRGQMQGARDRMRSGGVFSVGQLHGTASDPIWSPMPIFEAENYAVGP